MNNRQQESDLFQLEAVEMLPSDQEQDSIDGLQNSSDQLKPSNWPQNPSYGGSFSKKSDQKELSKRNEPIQYQNNAFDQQNSKRNDKNVVQNEGYNQYNPKRSDPSLDPKRNDPPALNNNGFTSNHASQKPKIMNPQANNQLFSAQQEYQPKNATQKGPVLEKEAHNPRQIDMASQREKHLEESLKNEILVNEEQRSYIELLKQELEKKLIETGFMSFFKTNNSSNLQHIDIYVELQNIKGRLLSKDEQIETLELKIEENEMEIDGMKQALESAQQEGEKEPNQEEIAENQAEVTKLQQQKEDLLDFIEDLKQNQLNLETKLQEQAHQLEEYENQQQGRDSISQRDQNDWELRVKQLELENQELSQNGQDFYATIHHLTDQIKQKDLEVDKQRILIRSNQQEIEKYLTENTQLQIQVEEFSSKYYEIAKEQPCVDETQKKLENLIKKSVALEHQIKVQESSLQDKNKELEQLRETKRQNDKNNLEKTILGEEIQSLKNENESLRKELQNQELRLENDITAKSGEINTLFQQNSELRIELRKLQQDQQFQCNEFSSNQEKIQYLEEELTQYQMNMSLKEEQINELRNLNLKKDSTAAELCKLQIKFDANQEFYQKQIKDLQSKLKLYSGFTISSSEPQQVPRKGDYEELFLELLEYIKDQLGIEEQIKDPQIETVVQEIQNLVFFIFSNPNAVKVNKELESQNDTLIQQVQQLSNQNLELKMQYEKLLIQIDSQMQESHREAPASKTQSQFPESVSQEKLQQMQTQLQTFKKVQERLFQFIDDPEVIQLFQELLQTEGEQLILLTEKAKLQESMKTPIQVNSNYSQSMAQHYRQQSNLNEKIFKIKDELSILNTRIISTESQIQLRQQEIIHKLEQFNNLEKLNFRLQTQLKTLQSELEIQKISNRRVSLEQENQLYIEQQNPQIYSSQKQLQDTRQILVQNQQKFDQTLQNQQKPSLSQKLKAARGEYIDYNYGIFNSQSFADSQKQTIDNNMISQFALRTPQVNQQILLKDTTDSKRKIKTQYFA